VNFGASAVARSRRKRAQQASRIGRCGAQKEAVWYIIPVSEIADDQSFLYVFPNGYPEFDKLGRPIPERETKDYEAYKDRWDLL
jgi:hypothetical protein